MPQISAFIFDLDGVITDTAEYHYRAWKRLADEEGLPFSREDNEALRGVSRRESLLRLLKGKVLPEAQMEEYMARKNAYYRAFLTQITAADLLEGVADFLAQARAHGLKLGIGSASKNARDVLNGLGITDQFDAIGDGYSVSRTKPAPDLFVWVAGRLGVPPAECVVFEDAEAGIAAARECGMYSVGIGDPARVGAADLILPNLAGAQVDHILSRLANLAH
ncbi:MAG: beta-phosphoglucomutase [Candidatus Thermofonsia Clade 1 bacterium]|uniref:Beta-phosphoglucomutase n=1 Tax=Candidatus Thermofonsia Clade 1 bacterium TaxID=2364210 RepID=A0A2M8PGV1_9CHLR|nr:MAG: beta-phosphoglucomutase [Candidatus Thermofonsia Clade 1 bacterium]RMF50026.1 MAG: beta-phosphoglucomutase [Chloroflexota bacterium]